MIKNTKLGIPDAMLVALIFLAGIVDTFLMVALVIYVLLFEKGKKVRDAAQKALLLFGLFAILQGGVSALDYVIRIIFSKGLPSAFSYLISCARIVTYMVFGIREALAYMSMRGAGISMQQEEAEEPVQQPQSTSHAASQTQASAPQAMVCPSCGNPVDKGVHFCKKCGAKTIQ